MPKLLFPTTADFVAFEKQIKALGFLRYPRQRTMAGLFKNQELTEPSRKPGTTVKFFFMTNGLTVWVNTTFLDFEERFKEKASGWVIIRQNSQKKYFSRPMRRTKNFLKRLLLHATIAKERALERPYCPGGAEDGHFMNITKGKGLKSVYWSCEKCGEKLPWDINMSEKSIKLLKPERKARTRYNKTRKKAGLPPFGWAMLHRKSWGFVDPGNQF